MSQRGLLLVLSGPSGVGKGTVRALVADRLGRDVAVSTSVTTRAPRPGEVDGLDYHFVDRAAFDRLVERDALLEWAEFAGNRYGTPRSAVEDAVADGRVALLEIEVQGALQVRRAAPDALLVFLLPPSWEALERRLRGRDTEDDATIRRRLAIAEREVEVGASFDVQVVNDDLDDTVEEVVALVAAARRGQRPTRA